MGTATIDSCLFISCYCSKSGGAIYANTAWVDLLNSCVTRCSTAMHGSALYAGPDKSSSNNNIYYNSFVDGSAADMGTVYVTEDGKINLESVNFTACYAATSGSAITIDHTSPDLNAKYTILRCLSGKTGIDTYCSDRPSIDHCNFYDNWLDQAVLHGKQYAMDVDSCIFRNSTKEISITDQKSSSKFHFTNCVFSGPFPPETAWYTLGDNNQANTTTMSFVIHGIVGQEYCPTNSPTASISQSPTA
jgi:predicted outer membrane repeat protein